MTKEHASGDAKAASGINEACSNSMTGDHAKMTKTNLNTQKRREAGSNRTIFLNQNEKPETEGPLQHESKNEIDIINCELTK